MARYRKIDPRIWNDEKFMSLSHEGQRMFLFVLTHPAMTGLGAFRMSREGLKEELGLDSKEFAEPFQQLLDNGLVKYDERAFLIFAPNFLKYNPPENPNVIKGWAGVIDLLPECPLLLDVLDRAKNCASKTDAGSRAFSEALGRVTETLSERYDKPTRKSMPKQEQEQEQEQEQDKKVVAATDAKPKREPTVLFPDSIPAEWRQAALTIRQDVTPERVFLKLRGRYAPTTTKKTMGNWRKIFIDWVGREYPETGRSTVSGKTPLAPHKDPAFHYSKEYYDKAVNPDGTTNWGV